MKEQEISQQMYIHLQDEQFKLFVGWLKKKESLVYKLGNRTYPRRDKDGSTKYFPEETQCVEDARCFIKKHYLNDPVQLATDITQKHNALQEQQKKAQAANFTFFSQQSDTPLAEQLAAAMNNHNSNIFNNTYSALGEIRLERESSTTDEIFDVDSDDDVQSLETPPKKQKTTVVNEIDDIVEPQHVGQFVNKLMSYDDANRTRVATEFLDECNKNLEMSIKKTVVLSLLSKFVSHILDDTIEDVWFDVLKLTRGTYSRSSELEAEIKSILPTSRD